jgi:ABC-type transport system substrate-binding protein
MMSMNKKIKTIGLAICLAFLGIILAGRVGQQAEEAKVGEEEKVAVPQTLEVGEEAWFMYMGVADPAVGWSSWFSRRAGIYETLTKLDHNMELQPWLATSWEVVDEHTLRITTHEPFAPLVYHLSDPLMAIVSSNTKEGEIPAGTGPFKFLEQREGEYVVVERFADYWDGAAKLEKVTFRLIPEAMTKAMALETGEIDVAVALTAVDSVRLEKTARVKVATGEIHRTDFIIINCQQEPLNDASTA